jgi:hypothetical protein
MFNKQIQGWINYYTHFYKSEIYDALRYINGYLVKWVRRKFKKRRARRRAEHWLGEVAKRDRNLFAHWKFGILPSVEETQNTCSEPEEAGHAGLAGLSKREHTQRVLGGCKKWYSYSHDYKQKTRTGRILQHPEPVRVLALKRLNRRVPNGTHSGVRGRSLN